MNCRHISALLSPYMDAQLPPGQAADVAAHLRDCQTCRDELESLRVAARLAVSLPCPRRAVDLAPSVVARAAASPWPGRWQAVRDLAALVSGPMANELGRAFVLAAVFIIVWSGRDYQAARLVLSWPARVAAAAQTGTTQMAAGFDRLSSAIESVTAAPLRPKASPRPQGKPQAAPTPTTSAIVVARGQEVSGDVIS